MAAWAEISIGFRDFARRAGREAQFGKPSEIGWIAGLHPLITGKTELFRRRAMAKAYYSTVFERPAPDIWKIIRDFNNYPVWVGGAGESRIEDGKSGDTVGAIRNVLYQGRHIRQRLLAQSDLERSQSYEFCEAPTLPMTGFQATLRVTPVVDGDRAFVEWWANFDCEAACRDELTETLRSWFGKWLESLRQSMEAGPTKFPTQAAGR
jgi:Polyketide cyclase / dehydrase and lipid transport